MNRPTLAANLNSRWSLRRWGKWAGCSLAGASLALAGGCFSSSPRFKSEADQFLTTPATASSLRIDNDVGNIKVVAVSGATEVRAEVLKRGKGRTPVEADEALAEIIVTLAPDPNAPGTILGTVDHPRRRSSWGNNPKQYEVEWRITAPPGMALDVRNDVGRITIQDFSNGVRVLNDVGEIRAENIQGGLEARTDVGEIHAAASGPIELRSDVGDIFAVALPGEPGPVSITADVGRVTLSLPDAWEGEVYASTDVGSLERGLNSFRSEGRQTRSSLRGTVGSGAPGRVDIKTDVGDVQVRHAGAVTREHRPEPGDRRDDPRGQPM